MAGDGVSTTVEASSRVERLHLHLAAGLQNEQVVWRLRAESAVRGALADAEPLMGGAVVVIRRWRLVLTGTPEPGTADLAGGARALQDAVRGATADPDVVRFADAAELLAAHALAVVRGQQGGAWWWETLGWSGPSPLALGAAWTAWPAALPAAAALMSQTELRDAVESAGPQTVAEALAAVRSVYAMAPVASQLIAEPAGPSPQRALDGTAAGRVDLTGEFDGAAVDFMRLLLQLAGDPSAARVESPLRSGAGYAPEGSRGSQRTPTVAEAGRRTAPDSHTARSSAPKGNLSAGPAGRDETRSAIEEMAALAGSATPLVAPRHLPGDDVSGVLQREGRVGPPGRRPQGLDDRVLPGPSGWQPDGRGVDTGLGGVFFLVNVLTDLGLPASAGPSLAAGVGGWGSVEALARAVAAGSGEREADPVWGVLSALAGRPRSEVLGWRLDADVDVDVACWPPLLRPELLADSVDAQMPDLPGMPGGLGPGAVGLALGAWLLDLRPVLLGYLADRLRLPASEVGSALLQRTGRCVWTRTHVDVELSLGAASVPVRRAALDRDPGWVPDLGRVVTFHYR